MFFIILKKKMGKRSKIKKKKIKGRKYFCYNEMCERLSIYKMNIGHICKVNVSCLKQL